MKYQEQRIKDTIALFPETFGLRGFPGMTFRIGLESSYVNDEGTVMLYTQLKTLYGWLDFAKASYNELKSQIKPQGE